MHEYSIVQSLVDSVESLAREHAASVHHVYVDIGELAGVDCDLLQTAYDTFRFATHLRERAADDRTDRGAVAVPPLQRPDPARRHPEMHLCDEPAKLAAGDEIVLKRVELEVA